MRTPLIIGNAALSLDGKIAPYDRSRLSISCAEDFSLRDQFRAWTDGVLIGGQTLLSDSPSLLLKDKTLLAERAARGLTPQPAGIALCGRRSPSPDNRFFHAENSRRIIFAGSGFEGEYDGCEVYRAKGELPEIVPAMEKAYSLGIRTILAEGGGTLLFNLLESGLMKEFYLSVHPIIIGGAEAPTVFDGKGFSAGNVRKLTVVGTSSLSDGGMTYHCTVDGALPATEYKNNILKFMEVIS